MRHNFSGPTSSRDMHTNLLYLRTFFVNVVIGTLLHTLGRVSPFHLYTRHSLQIRPPQFSPCCWGFSATFLQKWHFRASSTASTKVYSGVGHFVSGLTVYLVYLSIIGYSKCLETPWESPRFFPGIPHVAGTSHVRTYVRKLTPCAHAQQVI